MLRQCVPPAPVDEDAPHRLGCRAKEMDAVVPGAIAFADEAQPGFVNQVGGNDELVFDVYRKELDDVTHIVRDGMEKAAKLKVPLVADIQFDYRLALAALEAGLSLRSR